MTGLDGDDERAVMLREIALQPAFVRDALANVVARTWLALRAHETRALGPVLLTGCGDSLIAGAALRGYLAAATGRWTDAVEALELARYREALPPDVAVLGISNSGSVALTLEAIRTTRERGAWTFAITTSATNELARTAETLVHLDVPPNVKTRADGSKLVTPGTLTYTASLVGVAGAALALGTHAGVLDEEAVGHRSAELLAVADAMEATLHALGPAIEALAPTFAPNRTTVIVGGGPNLATAHFGAAKWYEALQWPAHAAHVEEWAHEAFFFTGPTTDTIVLAPPGPSFARACEQLRAADAMGSRTIALCAARDARTVPADVVLTLPSDVPEPLTPFVYQLPLQVLAVHLAIVHDRRFFGFDDPQRQAVNFGQVFTPGGVPR